MRGPITPILIILFLANIALAQSQPADAAIQSVAWEKLQHGEMYALSILREARNIKIPDKYPATRILSYSPIYLYCETSGALIQAQPEKKGFWILIFPRTSAKTIDFKVVDSKSIEGIDMKALIDLLGAQTPGGYGPKKNPIRVQAATIERTLE